MPYVFFSQGLPGPPGDIGREGPQGKQVRSPFTYLIVHICCDLNISCYDWFKQGVVAFEPLCD